MTRITVVRYLAWAIGLAGLAWLVPTLIVDLRTLFWVDDSEVLLRTAFGSATAASVGLEVAAAISFLLIVALAPSPAAVGWLGLAGVTWLVPGLAGWPRLPVELATIADGWGNGVPALVVIGVAPLLLERVPRWLWPVALAGGLVASASRLFLIDPFLDVSCWRNCRHNPLAIAGTESLGPWLARVGGLVVLVCAVVVCVRWARGWRTKTAGDRTAGIGAVCLLLGSTLPALLQMFVPEGRDATAYLLCFLAAQLGAVVLAGSLVRDRLLHWRLSTRLTRLASTLPSSPPPGGLTEALRSALPDPRLEIRYWAPDRDTWLDSEGVEVSAPGRDDRVTLVSRGPKWVAAMLHSAAVDSRRIERALGPAMRLALENEQLRAATLAELTELRQSRARLVERGSLERRRLERNLHDGAQQRVVSLVLLVRMLKSAATEPGALTLIQQAEKLIQAIMDELRRVARGIHPAMLSDSGLAGAVRDLAETSTDVAVSVEGLESTRYRPIIEVTAYQVVAAALADARARRASSVVVSASGDAGALVLDVQDDAAPGPGPAVADLAVQVGALAGRLLVDHDGMGSRVRLDLPCGS
ncbi:MAG TPA: histidine kinase [Propionibacteriaceae bacterium]|nr:histidine kinase [Propionibacteriaceae bacterium]